MYDFILDLLTFIKFSIISRKFMATIDYRKLLVFSVQYIEFGSFYPGR